MTSPNVGKVTLEAAISGDLRSQLTREIHDQVLPELKKLHSEIAANNDEINKLNARPIEELADAYGVVSDEIEKVGKATRYASRGETAYRSQVLRTADAIKARARVASQARAEERKNGEVSLATQQALERASEQAAIAIERRNTMKAEWEARLQAIEKARAEAQRKHHNDLMRMNDAEVDSLHEIIDMIRKEADEKIRNSIKATDQAISDARKEIRQLEADDRKKERLAEREERRAERTARREERDARRRERLALLGAKRGVTSPVALVGEIGRALSGFAPRLSTGAFSTIASGLLLIAGAGASAAQSLWLLPAAATAVGAAMGTLALATAGFGDTIEALISGDLDKFDAAIQNLSPNAQQAALEIQAIFPVFKELKNVVQDAFFADSPQMIRNFTAQYLPIVQQLGTTIAGAMNQGMKAVYAQLMTPETLTQIQGIVNQIGAFFQRLVPSIQPLMQAFLDIAEVGASLLPGLATGAGTLAENFAEFIRNAKESGKLREWLQRGLDTVGKLAIILWDVGRAIMSLAPVAEQVLPYIVAAFEGLANIMTDMPVLIYAIVGAFMAWAAVKTVKSLITDLAFLTLMFRDKLPKAIDVARTKSLALGDTMNRALGTAPTNRLVGGLTAVENGLTRTETRAQRLKGTLSGLGGGLLTAGKFIGGTAATLGIGFALEDIVSKNLESSSAVDAYTQSALKATEAQNNLNNSLLASGGAWDANTMAAAKSRIGSVFDDLEAKGNDSLGSFLDQFRDAQGSLWGGFTSQIFDFDGSNAQNNKKFLLDQQRDEYKQAFDLLKKQFGGNEEGLQKLVMGDQANFDLLIKNLTDIGPSGEKAAEALRKVREDILGASEEAAAAGPILQRLGPDVEQSALLIKNAFDALPEDVPINIHDEGAKEAAGLLTALGQQVLELPDGRIVLKDEMIPEVSRALEALGIKITTLPDKTIKVTMDENALANTQNQIAGLDAQLKNLILPPIGTGSPTPPGAPVPGAPPLPPGLANTPLAPFLQTLPGQGPPPPLPVGTPVAPAVLPGDPNLTGNRPVPPNPKDERGNTISEADRKKAIEASINPNDFVVNPWATPGSPNVSNGALQVQVQPGGLFPQGLPQMGFPAGAAGGPSLWDKIAQAESSGNWQNADTGNNGHFGGLQFSPETWRAFGGLEFAPMPHQATREQQIAVANRTAFTGYNGTRPQGLGAWEVITKGLVPGVNVNTPQSAFLGGGGVGPGGPFRATGTGGLLPAAQGLLEMVRQAFPQVTEIGGVRQDAHPDHPSGRALDIMIPGGTTRGGANPAGKALGDQIWQWLMGTGIVDPNGSLWRTDTGGDHYNHIHARIMDGMENAVLDYTKNMFATTGPNMINPATGMTGAFQVDQQALIRAQQAVEGAARDVSKAAYELAVATEQHKQNLISDQDLLDKQWALQEAQEKLTNEQMDYQETARGKFKEAEQIDFSKLPFGHPAKILAGAIGGAGGSPEDIQALVSPILGAAADPIGAAAGGAVTDALSAFNLPTREGPPSDYTDLARQRNPLTPFAMAGYNVPDYTVAGGGPEAQNLLTNQGPPVDATGRMFSDTGALLDRSFTSLQAALEAKLDQIESVMNQVKDQLTEQVLGPTVEKATAAGIEGAAQAIGTKIGEAAAPIIAQAVANAIPSQGATSSPGGLVNTGVGAVNDAGGAIVNPGGQPRATGGPAIGPSVGPVFGGLPGVDSVHILAQRGEYVLDTSDVAMMGGVAGVDRWRRQLKTGRLPRFATGGGVIGDETVGADFFGVSQVPILGAIVNLLVRVLLKVIGVQIEVRDTLDEMAGDFRQFRGDAFQAFEASGRLMNDTSALLDRTGTSEQAAADERIRILKLVIEGIIKFIIEKLVVPIGKAVANSLINAGAGAAGGAIGASFPGGSIVGGIVSNVISSAGSAGVDIAAEIFTEFSLALTSVLVDMIAEALQGVFPGLMGDIFGGDWLATIFDPITALFTATLAPLLGILGGLGDMLTLPSFDEGGVAPGVGFMPKATIRPERVLSPQQTQSFDRLVDALTTGKASSSSRVVTVHAPITVLGGPESGKNVQSRLMALID